MKSRNEELLCLIPTLFFAGINQPITVIQGTYKSFPFYESKEFICPINSRRWHSFRNRRASYLDLCLFVPCFLAFFDVLISLGGKGLITSIFRSGHNFSKEPKQA